MRGSKHQPQGAGCREGAAHTARRSERPTSQASQAAPAHGTSELASRPYATHSFSLFSSAK